MKLKELKHNHSLTDLLKVLIFSILMITPLLSVATRCLYVICNKNAYQSAEITQTTYNKVDTYLPSNEVNTISDIQTGKYYQLSFTSNIFGSSSEELNFSVVSFTVNNPGIDTIELSEFSVSEGVSINIKDFEYKFYTKDDYIDLYIHDFEGNFSNDVYVYSDNYSITAIVYMIDLEVQLPQEFTAHTSLYVSECHIPYTYYEEDQATTLDNVFEYSVNKLAESPILSWTQQTAIYTGVSTMTTQLGISTPTIAMLIVYWFLLTVIYIIIDIIIKLFTWLTHMIGNKSV